MEVAGSHVAVPPPIDSTLVVDAEEFPKSPVKQFKPKLNCCVSLLAIRLLVETDHPFSLGTASYALS